MQTFPHYAVGWAWAFGTPFKWTKQVASHFGGTRQGMAISWPAAHQGRRRHPPPVPSRHRHRADDPRGDGHPDAGHRGRHPAEADGRREHGLHLGQGQRQRALEAHDAVLRDAGHARHLPRRVDGVHDAALRAVGGVRGPAPEGAQGHRERLHLGAVQAGRRSHAGRRHRGQEPPEARRDAEDLHGRGGEVQRAAARQPVALALHPAQAERDRRPHRVHLHRRDQQHPEGRRARSSSIGPTRSPPRWRFRRAEPTGCW